MLKKIVVIEDDELIRENVVDFLSLSSFDVRGFSEGIPALESINKEIPDLILCDISLPGLSGHDILGKLKENDATAEIPFVFLSAHAEKSDVRNSMDMGADDYLIKPFTMKQLFASVNSRLEKAEKSKSRLFKELNNKLENFPKILSHELNTPLNGILGLTALLLENLDSLDKEEIKQYLEAIMTSADRLTTTKQKLLVFFNLLNVTKPKVNEFVFLNQMQENLVKHLHTTAKSKNRADDIQYNLLTDPIINSLKVHIPYSYLFTIFEEQIDNAIKFSNPKSTITVNFKLEKEDLFIEIINEGQLKIKFNPNEMFMEVNNSLNGSQGFGLGIFIIKKLCSLFDCLFTLNQDESLVIAKTKIKCTY